MLEEPRRLAWRDQSRPLPIARRDGKLPTCHTFRERAACRCDDSDSCEFCSYRSHKWICTRNRVATVNRPPQVSLQRLGHPHFMITADRPIPAGKHQVRMQFAYDGGGLAKGGDVTLYYDGQAAGKGRVEMTRPMAYSADEACDVGTDAGSPASRLRRVRKHVHRRDQVGADRHRRRWTRPPDQTRGSNQHRDGQTVATTATHRNLMCNRFLATLHTPRRD